MAISLVSIWSHEGGPLAQEGAECHFWSHPRMVLNEPLLFCFRSLVSGPLPGSLRGTFFESHCLGNDSSSSLLTSSSVPGNVLTIPSFPLLSNCFLTTVLFTEKLREVTRLAWSHSASGRSWPPALISSLPAPGTQKRSHEDEGYKRDETQQVFCRTRVAAGAGG